VESRGEGVSITAANREALKRLSVFERNGGGIVSNETLRRWRDRFPASQVAALVRKGLILKLRRGYQVSDAGRRLVCQ
jgi:hypothetical protein